MLTMHEEDASTPNTTRQVGLDRACLWPVPLHGQMLGAIVVARMFKRNVYRAHVGHVRPTASADGECKRDTRAADCGRSGSDERKAAVRNCVVSHVPAIFASCFHTRGNDVPW